MGQFVAQLTKFNISIIEFTETLESIDLKVKTVKLNHQGTPPCSITALPIFLHLKGDKIMIGILFSWSGIRFNSHHQLWKGQWSKDSIQIQMPEALKYQYIILLWATLSSHDQTGWIFIGKIRLALVWNVGWCCAFAIYCNRVDNAPCQPQIFKQPHHKQCVSRYEI